MKAKQLLFSLENTRVSSLSFYKYRAPISCPKRGVQQDFWGAWHSSLPWGRESIISFTQMPRNTMQGFKTLNLLRIDMIRFSLINRDEPKRDLLMGRNTQAPHGREPPRGPAPCGGVSALGSAVGLYAMWKVFQISPRLRLDTPQPYDPGLALKT